MKSQEFNMPAFGVGPIYVIICLILTIGGICLHLKGYLYQGELREGKIIFIVGGILSILLGIYLWVQAVIVEKINKSVKEKKLITSGVYRLVRHSITYSKLFFINSALYFLGTLNNTNEKHRRKMAKK